VGLAARYEWRNPTVVVVPPVINVGAIPSPSAAFVTRFVQAMAVCRDGLLGCVARCARVLPPTYGGWGKPSRRTGNSQSSAFTTIENLKHLSDYDIREAHI